MKRLLAFIFLSLLNSSLFILGSKAGIVGEWTAYPAFSPLTEAEVAGDNVYFLASSSLYSVNTKDESVTVYDKTKTLSDCEINHIAWCSAANRLLILYSDNNIDLLEENGNTINLSDYYSKSMLGDKTVYAINIYDEYAYLSTGFGIIKLNMKKAEFTDTYNLGFDVQWTHLDDKYIYAESSTKGQYSALLSSNLLDKSNWTRTADYTAQNKYVGSELQTLAAKYKPAGSARNEHGVLLYKYNRLYSLPGWGSGTQIRTASIQIKEGDTWTYYDNNITYLTSRRYTGLNAICIDPDDHDHFYVASRSGLYEYRDGKAVTEYWFDNSPLECCYSLGPTHTNYTIISAMSMDKDNNIWCYNSEAEHPALYKLDPEGNWTTYTHNEMMVKELSSSFSRAESMMFDSRGLMWFVNNDWRTPCLVRYDPSTDKMTIFDNIINEDGTTFEFTAGKCVAEDKDGNIWFGANTGTVMLNADDVMTESNVFEQIKVPRNDGTGLADYLLSGVEITCIAVDNGNRKWIGTNGMGVYVIDSDNTTELHHFTNDNSDILSNTIENIAIDNDNGEVYIGTDKGLCSYTMDATTPSEELNTDNVYAYPNPVEPNYSGPITINGLTYNSEIKIVTATGQLVAKGRSNGGTFIWDGTNLEGKKVASGVYMVLAANEDANKGAVCKISIVR